MYVLTKINQKSIQKPQPIYFTDLPDKETIREAVGIATPVIKATILFLLQRMCKSGNLKP